LLDAAHLRPYRDRGSNDPRNGLVFCATHHRAFDKRLFGIRPSTRELVYRSNGPRASDLAITRSSLDHLPAIPHRDALEWCWEKFERGDAAE
jgi:putative restriction endonuclease